MVNIEGIRTHFRFRLEVLFWYEIGRYNRDCEKMISRRAKRSI